MNLLSAENFTAEREHRFLKVQLLVPHRVLSSSAINGGEQLGISNLLNCQTCEGSALHPRTRDLHLQTREQLHAESCQASGLDPATTAMLGTAANMDYAAMQDLSYEDARVTVFATAGVEGNAGRAGDVATWHEGETSYKPAHAVPGTINVILLFHQTLSPAALARSVVTLTEAKSAALADLAIGSRYGTGLATGTGTDQFAVACPLADSPRFHWTGKHAKLGELIGKGVKAAILEALRWQNGLEPSRTRSLLHALGRYSLREADLQAAFAGTPFLQQSLTMVVNDPRVASAGYAIATLLDRDNAGVIPHDSVLESVLDQCAILASSISAKREKFSTYRSALASVTPIFPNAIFTAIELGWSDKWN